MHPRAHTLSRGDGAVIGVITLGKGGWRIKTDVRTLCGVRFLEVSVPGMGKIGRCARVLRKNGVRRVLVSNSVPFDGEALRPWGVEPVSEVPLLRRCGSLLALSALEHLRIPPEKGTVALRGKSLSTDLCRTAHVLCPRVRQLVLSFASDKEPLARQLHDKYGMSVLWEENGVCGDVSLQFEAGARSKCPLELKLYAPKPDLCGAALTAPGLPLWADVPDLMQLAALWECGALPPKRLQAEWT